MSTVFISSVFVLDRSNHSGLLQGAAKVSILMIGQQAIMDAYLCLLHLTAGILVGKFSDLSLPACL